jgi:hypothetical protein
VLGRRGATPKRRVRANRREQAQACCSANVAAPNAYEPPECSRNSGNDTSKETMLMRQPRSLRSGDSAARFSVPAAAGRCPLSSWGGPVLADASGRGRAGNAADERGSGRSCHGEPDRGGDVLGKAGHLVPESFSHGGNNPGRRPVVVPKLVSTCCLLDNHLPRDTKDRLRPVGERIPRVGGNHSARTVTQRARSVGTNRKYIEAAGHVDVAPAEVQETQKSGQSFAIDPRPANNPVEGHVASRRVESWSFRRSALAGRVTSQVEAGNSMHSADRSAFRRVSNAPEGRQSH